MFRIAPHFRLQEWVAEEKGYAGHGIFEDGKVGAGRYQESVVTLRAV